VTALLWLVLVSATFGPSPRLSPEVPSLRSVLANAAKPDSVRVNEFLSYDSGKKEAHLRLVAGQQGGSNAMNFNGAANGNVTITVPLNWRVETTFENEDSALPHSMIIIPAASPIPALATKPAFAGATTGRLEEGILQGERATMDFRAERAGKYLVFCGVPGHAQAGMYLNLVVSASATVPEYK
jgi:sulfocyanin